MVTAMRATTRIGLMLSLVIVISNNALAADKKTHMNQPPSQHVMLVWTTPAPGATTVCDEPNREFRRVFPDGSFELEAFVVPDEQLLVVTDVDAVIVAGAGQTFGLGFTVHAAVMPEELAESGLVPARTEGVTILNSSTQAVSVRASFSSGVFIGPGQQVCVRGDARTGLAGFLSPSVASASILGYLISE